MLPDLRRTNRSRLSKGFCDIPPSSREELQYIWYDLENVGSCVAGMNDRAPRSRCDKLCFRFSVIHQSTHNITYVPHQGAVQCELERHASQLHCPADAPSTCTRRTLHAAHTSLQRATAAMTLNTGNWLRTPQIRGKWVTQATKIEIPCVP